MVISGHQISSTAPSEAGKTIHTRSSSAVTDRTHGPGGKSRIDGEQNETTEDDSGDIGNEKQGAQVDGMYTMRI